MNSKLPDDTFSAYFDGEASPEERADIEQLLGSSNEVRRKLQEFETLSELVRSLPSESAPTEFVSAVLHQAERETLLAGVQADMPHRPARRWLKLGSSIAATAALMLVVVWIMSDRPDGARQFASNATSSTTFNAVARQSSPSRDADAALEMDRYASVDPAGSNAATDEFAAKAESLVADEPTAPVRTFGGRADDAPMESVAATLPPGAALEGASEAMNFQWADAEVGDVIRYLKQVDDEVAVVEVTVLDRKQALNTFFLLLSNNGVEPESTIAGDTQPQLIGRLQEELNPTEFNAGTLFAVYVEATDDQIADMLNSGETKDVVVDMTVHRRFPGPEIQSLAVDALSKEKLASESIAEVESDGLDDKAGWEQADKAEPLALNRRSAGAASGSGAVAPTDPESDTKDVAELAGNEEAPASEAVGGQKPPVGRKVVASRSYQQWVSIPASALHRESKSAHPLADLEAAVADKSRGLSANKAMQPVAPGVLGSRREPPRRVLFVIQERP